MQTEEGENSVDEYVSWDRNGNGWIVCERAKRGNAKATTVRYYTGSCSKIWLNLLSPPRTVTLTQVDVPRSQAYLLPLSLLRNEGLGHCTQIKPKLAHTMT